jgi:hypothetical protein
MPKPVQGPGQCMKDTVPDFPDVNRVEPLLADQPIVMERHLCKELYRLTELLKREQL